MSVSSLGPVGQQGQQTTTGYDAYQHVEMGDFIKLLVAELGNQDPLNPMENSEILAQVSQIREIASNDLLSKTLESVQMGQNVAIASSLLERTIVALTDDAEKITGRVERISIEGGVAKLHVGDATIDLENVAEILPEAAGTAEGEGQTT